MSRKIGITTTIPVEIIYSAGAIPVDLNNVFISSPNREKLIQRAEVDGFPRNICGWIKGIYGAVLEYNIKEIVAVMQGDCSNTHALAEILDYAGVRVVPFSFPYDRDYGSLKLEMQKLASALGVISWEEIVRWKEYLDEIRYDVNELDRLTWQENKVTGRENHIVLVSTSDFEGNPELFWGKVKNLIVEARERKPFNPKIRLAYIGVPPMFNDIYDVLEYYGANIVFNEIQRQFSMPFGEKDLVKSYLKYTYPYPVFLRIEDIKMQCQLRNVHGIIHYTQSFCFRQVEDIIMREELKYPIIMIEGCDCFSVDARTKMRLQAFVEMVSAIVNS